MALNAVEGLFWFRDILQARLFRSVNWRGFGIFYQALKTSGRSILQAEIVTLDRVAVTLSPVWNVMDTWS